MTATLTPLSTTTTVHSTLVISQTNLNEMSGGVASIWDYEGGLRKATDGELQVLTDTLLLPHMATNLQTIDKPPFALGQFRLIQPTTDVTCAEPRLQMPHIGETPDKLHINLSIQTSNCAFVFTLAGTTNISPTLRPALMMNGGSTHPVSVTLTVLTGSMSSKTVNVPLNTVKQAIPLVPDMAIEVTIPANTFVSLDYADTALFGVEDVTGVPADAETRLFLSDAAPRDEPAQKAWELDQWTYAATGLATYQKQNGQTLDGIPDNGAHLVFSQLAMVGPTNEKYPYGGDSCAWHTMTPRGGGFWFANADSRITNALCGSIAVRGQGRYVITGVSQENLRHWGADGDPRVAFGIAGHMSGRYRITIAQVDLSTSDTKEELVVTKVITSTPWLQLTTGRPQFQADWKGEAFVVIEFDTPFGQIDIGPTAGATSVDVRWPTKPQDAPQASNQLDLVRTSLPPATTNRGPVVATPGGR
ncbi:hypothetical protein HGA91_02980 [candidate division WWE3 bacterium]|nr:hypothetical protein [candidate division WWE3 bacterium]